MKIEIKLIFLFLSILEISQFGKTLVFIKLFKEDCITVVLNLFDLCYFVFVFGYCHEFCIGNIPTLVEHSALSLILPLQLLYIIINKSIQ